MREHPPAARGSPRAVPSARRAGGRRLAAEGLALAMTLALAGSPLAQNTTGGSGSQTTAGATGRTTTGTTGGSTATTGKTTAGTTATTTTGTTGWTTTGGTGTTTTTTGTTGRTTTDGTGATTTTTATTGRTTTGTTGTTATGTSGGGSSTTGTTGTTGTSGTTSRTTTTGGGATGGATGGTTTGATTGGGTTGGGATTGKTTGGGPPAGGTTATTEPPPPPEPDKAAPAKPKTPKKEAATPGAPVDLSEKAAEAIAVGGVGRLDGVPDFLAAPTGADQSGYHNRAFQPLPPRLESLQEMPHPERWGVREALSGGAAVAAVASPASASAGPAAVAGLAPGSVASGAEPFELKVMPLKGEEAPARKSQGDGLRDAHTAMRLREYEAAGKLADQALAQDPANVDGLLLASKIALKRKLCADARRYARSAVDLAPRRAEARKALARSLACAGTEEALLEAQREAMLATELDPRDADAWAARAAIEWRLGKKSAAIRSIEEAERLDPRYRARARAAREGRDLGDEDLAEDLAADELAGPARGPAGALGAALALVAFASAVALWRRRRREEFAGPAAAAAGGPTGGSAIPKPSAGLAAKYEFVRSLGRTPEGEFLEARDRTLGRTVAIRRASAGPGAGAAAALLAAARSVGSIRHPGLLDVYEVAEEKGEVSIVFEWLKGKTAAQVLASRGRLPPSEALEALEPVSEAVEASHARGVVRGRVSLETIVFGEAGTVKLADLDGREDRQLRGAASDVEALARCLVQLLTGRRPTQPLIGLAGSLPGCPAELDALVRDVLSPADSATIVDAAEFTRRLRAARFAARTPEGEPFRAP